MMAQCYQPTKQRHTFLQENHEKFSCRSFCTESQFLHQGTERNSLLNNPVKTFCNESSQCITECPGDRNPPKARYPYNLAEA